PVSRWKTPVLADIAKNPRLEIVASCVETGPNIIVEAAESPGGYPCFARRLYILNHPEYETDVLGREYKRDVALDPATPLPRNYFPGDDPSRPPVNTWRHTANIYTNWIKAVYEATPYLLADIPKPSAAEGLSTLRRV
nr:homoserine O-succinyltransferase [Pseudomonadota bacterium]